MSKISRGFILIIVMLTGLLATSMQASAQAHITLDILTIQLWPEFDRPSMLVIYEGADTFSQGEVAFTFTMPSGADFHVTAYIDAEKGLVEIPREVSGNKVTMRSPNGTFHIEFYDPALDTSKSDRSYTYTWPGDYAVNSLTWIVQQPPSALNMTLIPPATETNERDFGLNYQLVPIGKLDQGEQATLHIAYTKANDALTNELIAQPTEVPAAPESISTNSTALIVVLALVALGLIGSGAYLYSRRERDETDRAQTRKKRAQAKSSQASKQPAVPTRFCTQCGTQALDPADKFCRKCGAALR
jgi:hypothetical protein